MKYLTASEMRVAQRCKRKWYLYAYRRLIKVDQNNFFKPLGIGNRVHEALAVYYTPDRPVDPREWLSQSRARDLRAYPDEQDAIMKECDLAEIMIDGYMEWLAETGEDQALTVIEAEGARVARLEPGRDVFLLSKLDARVRHDVHGDRLALEHKGQPLEAQIMTPAGPRSMGDLSPGDHVLGSSGGPTEVLATYPLGEQDLYRVTFSDDTSLLVTGDHVWTTSLGDLTTLEVKNRVHRRMKIQRCGPLQFDEQDLPFDPYVLGLLIGDGCLRHGRVELSTCDEEIVTATDEFDVLTTTSYPGRQDGWKRFYVVKFGGQTRATLQELGLMGRLSYEKFVPPLYLVGSAAQRLSLLQGLMDTDGSVGPQIRYVTSSKQLMLDVQFLVESLGGTLKIKRSMGHVGTRAGGYDTRVSFYGTVQGLRDVHRLARKRVYRDQLHERGRVIKSVEFERRGEAQCILVDADDGLYVTEHSIVTHNTVGDLKQHLPELRLNQQVLTEHLVEFMALKEEGHESDHARGVLFNMLRKVKRTARAKPPFYSRTPIHHSVQELRNHWYHVVSISDTITDMTNRLDGGESHHMVAPPSPSRDCHWDCEYFRECPMIDNGEDYESSLAARFTVGDPLARYQGLIDVVTGRVRELVLPLPMEPE